MTYAEMVDKIRADVPGADIDADDLRRWSDEVDAEFRRTATAWERVVVEHAAEMVRSLPPCGHCWYCKARNDER